MILPSDQISHHAIDSDARQRQCQNYVWQARFAADPKMVGRDLLLSS